MVIQDKSTTISCSRCSDEYTIAGYLLSDRTMRRKVKHIGWEEIEGEDFCPKCAEQHNQKATLLPNGHFTASQLLLFRDSAICAIQDKRKSFLCPVCGCSVIIQRSVLSKCLAECTGCGLTHRER